MITGPSAAIAVPTLAIIQARLGSKRFPNKVLALIDGEPLIRRVWRRTVDAFGAEDTVVAIPGNEENVPLFQLLHALGANVYAWDGPESDVLARFWNCAHRYRWHDDSVIVRVTADDPFKDPLAMRKVAAGYRLPVEIGGEAFTLKRLNDAHERVPLGSPQREHITHALFPTAPPPPPPGVWSIDTPEDYEAVVSAMEGKP